MNKIILIIFFTLSLCGFSCQAQQPVIKHGIRLTMNSCTDADIDKYAVYRSNISGGPYNQVCDIPSTVNPISCLDQVPSGLVDGKYFYISQCHSVSLGWSQPSAEVSPNGTIPKAANNGNAAKVASAIIE
jgi:hypothetical protein